MFNYDSLKKVLFMFNPEIAHSLGECALKTLPYITPLNNYMIKNNFIVDYKLQQNILGITFQNPVGLAAGFDKNATMINSTMALGFGFTEIGTMTPKPQNGNPKPRLFRHKEEKSLQNAMGFNNEGSAVVAQNLSKVYPNTIPIGANIGKNKNTSQEEALNDYKILIEKFKDISDYLVINISSPNTPNLRTLQNEKFITELFKMAKKLTKKPIFLKISPDMETKVAIDLCNKAIVSGASGIIASNTTIDYSLLENPQSIGGISGTVLAPKAYELFKEIAKELFGKTILISVGGISSAEEAYKRLKAGASLVQCYTGFIFEGPSMTRHINAGILELMKKDGFKTIQDVIGSDLK